MRKLQTLIYLLLLSTTSVFSQKIILNGYIFEEFNRSFFIRSKVTVLETVLKPKIDNHSLFFAAQKKRTVINLSEQSDEHLLRHQAESMRNSE